MTRASSLASSLIGKTVSGAQLYSPVMRAAIALFKLASKAMHSSSTRTTANQSSRPAYQRANPRHDRLGLQDVFG